MPRNTVLPHSKAWWRHTLHWLIAATALSWAGTALAWSEHIYGTWQALAVMPAIRDAAPIKVESLNAFLAAEDAGLAALLAQDEQWARAHVPTYPPRPAALAYEADGPAATRRQRFLAALRINPNVELPLYLQLRPGMQPPAGQAVPWTEVTTLKHETTARDQSFVRLREGESVRVLGVIASASEEPDDGLDIGLWDDNGTPWGRRYGFGHQPFGDAALEFSSQAPFHMGFYHEAWIVYEAASFLRRTYPEYRIHLYRSLAAFALANGHPYWGWRFAGWALHYEQDLTQPYHATVLPGVSTTRMLWINTLDILGMHGAKERAIRFVSNRHLALENYQYHRMRNDYLQHTMDDPLLAALRDTSRDAMQLQYTDATPRHIVSLQAHAWADRTDAALVRDMPARYISDPDYVFEQTEPDIDMAAVMQQATPERQADLAGLLAELLRHFGTHTRVFIASLLSQPH